MVDAQFGRQILQPAAFGPVSDDIEAGIVSGRCSPGSQQDIEPTAFAEAPDGQDSPLLIREQESLSGLSLIYWTEALEIHARPYHMDPAREDSEVLNDDSPECFR
jgi:hypothetical protein